MSKPAHTEQVTAFTLVDYNIIQPDHSIGEPERCRLGSLNSVIEQAQARGGAVLIDWCQTDLDNHAVLDYIERTGNPD